MHHRGIILCNTCPGSVYEHKVYYEIEFVNQRLRCCHVCTAGNLRGFTFLNVDYFERRVPVWSSLSKVSTEQQVFTIFITRWSPDTQLGQISLRRWNCWCISVTSLDAFIYPHLSVLFCFVFFPNMSTGLKWNCWIQQLHVCSNRRRNRVFRRTQGNVFVCKPAPHTICRKNII